MTFLCLFIYYQIIYLKLRYFQVFHVFVDWQFSGVRAHLNKNKEENVYAGNYNNISKKIKRFKNIRYRLENRIINKKVR